MADRAATAAAISPTRAVPLRQLAPAWMAVTVLAAIAWAVTVILARSMGNGPGAVGLALLPFLGLWVVMMAAMMLPSVAPVAVLWTRLFTGAGAGPAASPTAAKWFGIAIFIVAGGYQLTSWKDWCLRRCRSPIGALMYYLGFSARARDIRVGLHHGATCAGCCWGLMIVLVAVGVMNLAVMAAIGVVIPSLLPGLHASMIAKM